VTPAATYDACGHGQASNQVGGAGDGAPGDLQAVPADARNLGRLPNRIAMTTANSLQAN